MGNSQSCDKEGSFSGFTGCHSCECVSSFALPVAKEVLERFKWKVSQDLVCEGWLPDLYEKSRYKVYTLRGSAFGSHWSVVLTNDDEFFFSIELVIRKVEGEETYRVSPQMKRIDESKKTKLNYKGVVEDAGFTLIEKALNVMAKFGQYSRLINNCQDYCNGVLKEFGLGDETAWTDGSKVLGGAAIAAGAVLVGGGLLGRLIAMSRQSNEEEEEECEQ